RSRPIGVVTEVSANHLELTNHRAFLRGGERLCDGRQALALPVQRGKNMGWGNLVRSTGSLSLRCELPGVHRLEQDCKRHSNQTGQECRLHALEQGADTSVDVVDIEF